MSNELDDLAKLLKSPPPPPSEGAKESAIFNAMRAFEQKNATVRQGSPSGNRLINKLRDLHAALIGENPMKKVYVLAGGLAVATLTVTLLNSSMLTDIVPIPQNVSNTAMSINPQLSAEEKGKLEKENNVLLQQKDDADASALSAAQPVAPPMAPGFVALQEREEKKAEPSQNGAAAPQDKEASKEASMVMDEAARRKAPLTGGNLAAPASKMMSYEMRAMGMPAPEIAAVANYHDEGRDQFTDIKTNSVKVVKEEPVSTFSIDVDTSSYSFVRQSLNNGTLPQKDAVRVEEMINYFPYNYETPSSKEEPFKTNLAVFQTPWNSATKIVHIGIKGYEIEKVKRPHANLVFLLDTSGSMNEENKLPLVKKSMKMLLDSMQPEDTISIVTYAGSAGTALQPTKAKDKAKIIAALDNLGAGGSTAGAEGIRQAYTLAEQSFDKEGVNRVILATDGDFNVGITDPGELKSFVERKRQSGIFLSVLGFGTGNYNDEIMQTLAQNGNGNAAYIDTLNEARKVLVEEAGSTIFPIAKDVKIQVEFNPATVSEYRLIGYETRLLNREDFNNDKVDAGDIGSGHTVTALYEITPAGSKASMGMIDSLRYQAQPEVQRPSDANDKTAPEYAFVKIRYKLPESDTSKLISSPVTAALETAQIPQEARFAAAVAGFSQLLRGDSYLHSFTYDQVIELAQGAKGNDAFGYRAEFINLVRLAKSAAALQPLGTPGNPQPLE